MEMAKKIKTEVGDVTVLVNNAGIMPTHPIEQHTHQEVSKIMDINVMAHFWVRNYRFFHAFMLKIIFIVVT